MNMAEEKDLVLIYFEDKPLSFARIEGIEPDHKPDWYHVHLLLPVVGLDGQPEIEDIEVTAIVVRHSTLEEDGAPRHCHALYFDNVHPRDRERIIEFVDTLYE